MGDIPDATKQIAAGYICLAAALAWLTGFLVMLVVSPANLPGIALSLINMIGSLQGFRQVSIRRDPRAVLDWVVMVYLISVGVFSYLQAGVVAPIVLSLPALAAVAGLHVRVSMRPYAIALGLLVTSFSILAAAGVFGVHTHSPSDGSPSLYLVCIVLSTVAIAGVIWIANMSRDLAVHQLKVANASKAETAARTRIALEAASVGLWDMLDAAQPQFHLSESLYTLTGYSREEMEELIGNLRDLIHPDDVSGLYRSFAVSRKRMSSLSAEFRLKTKHLGYRWFSARARYARNTDGTIHVSGSLQDVSVIKAAEEALRLGRDQAREANKAKSDFIAIMSHEVRTPLNAIMGSVEVLKQIHHDVHTNEVITLIDEAGQGLLTLVDDLLDVSKIESRKIDLNPAPTDITTLLRRTIALWGPQARQKGLTLSVDCTEADSALLMLDGVRLKQIIGNLVSNAIKFSEAGGVTAILSTQPVNDTETAITLSVQDTGPGVPDTLAEKIFAPFEQAPGSASRGGAGLGLYISRELARRMGGDLRLAQSGGQGALFELSLTAGRAHPDSSPGEPDPEDHIWQKRSILSVDDNDNNRRILQLLLTNLGFDVSECASGAEAIDVCGIQKFDLILMDIVMPELDGIETLRQVRQDPDSLNRETPAAAITANMSPNDLVAYAAAGFAGVVAKPIQLRQMVETITTLLPAAEG